MKIEINEDRFLEEVRACASDVYGVCSGANSILGVFKKSDGSGIKISLVLEEIEGSEDVASDLDIIQVYPPEEKENES